MAQIQLENGAVYRGRVCIPHSDWTINTFGGGTSEIISSLQGEGFSNVSVWRDGDKLPADWPPAKKPSPCSDACVWIQATWGKPTGMYPSSGQDWSLFDHWVQTPAPKAAPPPQPSCVDVGGVCMAGPDCCSGFCTSGLCTAAATPPPGPAPGPALTCASEGMSCDTLACCYGTTCESDAEGYWGGGMRCMNPNDTGAQSVNPNPPQTGSNLALWILGAGILSVCAVSAYLIAKEHTDESAYAGSGRRQHAR